MHVVFAFLINGCIESKQEVVPSPRTRKPTYNVQDGSDTETDHKQRTDSQQVGKWYWPDNS